MRSSIRRIQRFIPCTNPKPPKPNQPRSTANSENEILRNLLVCMNSDLLTNSSANSLRPRSKVPKKAKVNKTQYNDTRTSELAKLRNTFHSENDENKKYLRNVRRWCV
eukprot:TRINITY_DN9288_c0_g2_i1.p2 TRINITY_DN9288_c0_g2~~TRINITY_DN9288_c0_g2_i1.p2  ORF type:complete len:108 (+),score=15.27 TRINITY_DN9288_c0_g2_i1:177-500(+)